MRGRYEMVPWVLVVMGLVGLFLGQPGYTLKIPRLSFCNGRTPGYYADVTTGCQVYHMCDGLGRQFSYSCPNATLFQQRMLICDHWYMVNCSRATADYDANLLIGQKDKHFVEDSEANPYSRTPRPDLLNAPSSPSEYNIIYRIGNSNLSPRDYVGVESDDENSTDQPTYFPPSHWSTEISRQQTTSKPLVDENQNQQAQYQNQREQYENQQAQYENQQAQSQNHQEQSQNSQAQNQNTRGFQRREFQNESGFQNEHVVVNREPQKEVDNKRNSTQNPKIRGKAIDFSSNKNGNNLIVNFKSNFKATTPVYPQSVEDTTRSPNNIGLLPPISYANENIDPVQETELTLELQPPQRTKQESDYSADIDLANFQAALKKPLESFPQEKIFEATHRSYPTTSKPIYQVKSSSQPKPVNFPSTFKATTPQYPSSVELTSPEPSDVGIQPPDIANINLPSNINLPLNTYKNNIKINFESRYKATTPNYPNFVEQTSTNPKDAGILPPIGIYNFQLVNPNTEAENNNDKNFYQNFESTFKATTPKYPTYVENTSPNPYEVGLLAPKRIVVYKSNFKATTPKYPSFVESTSPNPSDVGLVPPGNTVVNFHSDFKATTPNYPTHVESTSPDPGEAGLLAPLPQNLVGDNAKDFSNKYNLPLKFYQPHALDLGDYEREEDLQEIPGIRLSNFMKSFNRKQWQTLRLAFKIPEYDFPLDDATRPSYDSVVNSFEPISTRK